MLRSAFIPKLWLVLTSTLNPPFWSSTKSSSRSSDVVAFISSCSWVELSPLLAKLRCSLSSAVRALTVLLVVLVDGKRGFVTFMNISGYRFTLYIHLYHWDCIDFTCPPVLTERMPLWVGSAANLRRTRLVVSFNSCSVKGESGDLDKTSSTSSPLCWRMTPSLHPLLMWFW